MNSTNNCLNFQFPCNTSGYLFLPSGLDRFIQTSVSEYRTKSDHLGYLFSGNLESYSEDRICPDCGQKMHIKSSKETVLRHIPSGSYYSQVTFKQNRFYCEHCGHSSMQDIPFKAEGHRITVALKSFIENLLAWNTLTLKDIALIAGVGEHTVKAIDKSRLASIYVQDGKLKAPEKPARFLGIDEFKLHNGHQYATHIIDLESGNVLWIARGKKKQVVYDFIDTVGMDWMENVEVVACDMNSDFQEAFEEKCEWITIIFDHFHIVKNFNDKVISEVRKDEQKRLQKEGKVEQAKSLKGSKYILTSTINTLKKKDEMGEAGKVLKPENTLFGLKPVIAKTGYVKRYKNLIKENELLMTCSIVKEQLSLAYSCKDEWEMAKSIIGIIDTCRGTKNRHFEWFARLLENHFEGIIAHGTYNLSSGKIEGINNKIKTLRRQSYGYRDDAYFFLKIMDASRNSRPRNLKSHKIFH